MWLGREQKGLRQGWGQKGGERGRKIKAKKGGKKRCREKARVE